MDIPSWQQPMRLSLRGNGVRPLAASRALYAGAKAKADGVQLDAGFEKRSEISWQQPMRLSLRGNGVRPLAASRALYAGAKAKADGVQLDAGFEKRSEIFAVVKCSAESLEEEEAYLCRGEG